jgi:hypothetical protein
MKKGLLIISFLLFAASLFGVYKAYSLPTERAVTEEVTLLDYQHQGKFDYLVYLKPSYLYGPEPQEPLPPPPDLMKYPTGIIDRFNVTFNYRFVSDRPIAGTSEEVEVRAIVKSPGAKEEKEIILAPKTSKTGDFTITFPLDISDNISDNYITISDNISGSEITITAYVYATFETEAGPVFESFTQSLPMQARGPLVEVEGDLNYTSSGYVGELNYEQHGEFSYEVYLKPGSSFGPITLKPPSMISPTPAPPETMGPENTIMSKLVDGMNITFFYHLESSQPIKKLDEAVAIEAVLENPEKWSKTIELVPLTNKSGDFTVTFPLDLKQFSELFDTIQQETGGSASARNLTIKAKVHTLADTDFGTIDADFTQSINTDLTGDTLVWSDNLTKSEPGSIKTTRVVPQTEKYLGLPVSQTRILLAVVASIILVLFIFSLLGYFWPRQGKLTAMEKKAQQAQKKYKNIIVEIKELPEVKPGETVILLNSLDDLTRTAEGLLKPLLHKAEGQRHIYCVFDAATRYEYHLS